MKATRWNPVFSYLLPENPGVRMVVERAQVGRDDRGDPLFAWAERVLGSISRKDLTDKEADERKKLPGFRNESR